MQKNLIRNRDAGLFIKPTHVDPRFGLPSGRHSPPLPTSFAIGAFARAEGFILAETTNAVGLATTPLTLVQSAISLYFFDVTLAVFLVGYVAVDLALLLAARS